MSDPPPEGQEVTDVHKAMGMRKITGDRHVPAGVLVVTAAHPPSFPGGPEEGRFKIRTSVTKAETDVTAYTWLRVTLTCTSRDEIRMEEALPGAPTVVKFPITCAARRALSSRPAAQAAPSGTGKGQGAFALRRRRGSHSRRSGRG